MWHLGTWLSGGLGSAGLTAGLDDLRGLFQAGLLCDSQPKNYTVVCSCTSQSNADEKAAQGNEAML